jgi:predicted nucleotide-binding protein
VLLRRQVERAEEMLAQSKVEESEFHAWQNNTREYLVQSFGEDSQNVSTVTARGKILHVGGDPDPLYRSALRSQIAILNGCLEQLREKQIDWQSRPRSPERTPSSFPPNQGARLLARQYVAGNKLVCQPFPKAEYDAWVTVTHDLLRRAFDSQSSHPRDFMLAGPDIPDGPIERVEPLYLRRLKNQIALLTAAIQQLEAEAEITMGASVAAEIAAEEAPTAPPGRRVFLVHGHAEGPKEAVARLISKLDLEPVILHEQPDQGRTIIEKFEAHADVAYAVVLLTTDDQGGPRGGDVGAQQPRARQNVIFELGYFVGRLGRRRVCALYERGVELPSDYQGVLYVPLEDSGWRLRLAGEMRAAGLPVDLNKVPT